MKLIQQFSVSIVVVVSTATIVTSLSCTTTSVESGSSTASLRGPIEEPVMPILPVPSRGVASDEDWNSGPANDHDIEPNTVYVQQNWSSADREGFYRTPQGSYIMPLKFALALEKKDSTARFFSGTNLASYGFIPQKKNEKTNPWGLPIGFTIDGKMKFTLLGQHSIENGERQLGVNCALCHTSSFHYKGTPLRIDGGQTLASFQNFVRDMDLALKATREDSEKLERFLSRIQEIDKTGNSDDRQKLMRQFEATLAERGDWSNLNDANHHYGHAYNETSFAHGPGRIDAFSVIFNQVLARDLGVPSNAGEPNAPVSPPVIWDAPYHDWVQWNGLASNDPNNGGPLARNLGQVLGVFGHIDFSKQTWELRGYCSSARRENLERIEEWVGKLWSPQWPEEVLGKLDPAKVALGKKLFTTYKCSGCHQDINRVDPNRKIKAQLIPMKVVGTDRKFNENALSRVAQTTKLTGSLTRLKQGRPLEATEPSATVLRHAVAGAIAGTISPITCGDNLDVSGREVIDRWKKITLKTLFETSVPQADDDPNKEVRTNALVKKLAVYKARPLNGIWASPPFLHNGSVKSLYDLLLPPDQRTNFYLGCDEYDPVHAGLDCQAGDGRFLYDTSVSGNQPVGHDYGPRGANAEAERLAIVEYLKSI